MALVKMRGLQFLEGENNRMLDPVFLFRSSFGCRKQTLLDNEIIEREMATTMLRSVFRCYKDITRGICLINCVKNHRQFATVLNVELDQDSSLKKNNLLDAYHKERVNNEKTLDKLGHRKSKSFDEILKEERKKTVVRYTETEIKKGVWAEKSRRTGAVGMKIGMSLLWRKNGRPVRVTLIQVERNVIIY